ncbi:hypothetical protein AVEN_56469-1 [Araneus ventricosus]|uniref:Uncharacterized protein n=1 Tax=Araneus ventricosus TaxID=182803 RepID=A0A4Y2T0H7_ARAVE|nr:hypothetical protein AVEN_56469-1 [Araneus ventricosus]
MEDVIPHYMGSYPQQFLEWRVYVKYMGSDSFVVYRMAGYVCKKYNGSCLTVSDGGTIRRNIWVLASKFLEYGTIRPMYGSCHEQFLEWDDMQKLIWVLTRAVLEWRTIRRNIWVLA